MLSQTHREALLSLARASIEYALDYGAALIPEEKSFPLELQQKLATFVTLKKQDQLRGCIGSLVATQSLARDVSEHACAAAIQDTRFSPLKAVELIEIDISISILGPSRVVSFNSEEEMLDKIVAGEDGVILRIGNRRSTFLPSVWKVLQEKQDFLNQLKLKAGLPDNYWSDDIQISCYQTEEFSESSVC